MADYQHDFLGAVILRCGLLSDGEPMIAGRTVTGRPQVSGTEAADLMIHTLRH